MVVDTSVIIAIITNEDHKDQIIQITRGFDLLAPQSLHWELGNAFSAMFKRHRMTLDQALRALIAYREILIRLQEIEIETALKLASQLNIYAYDAYFIACAIENKCPLITLDSGLQSAAQAAGLSAIQVI